MESTFFEAHAEEEVLRATIEEARGDKQHDAQTSHRQVEVYPDAVQQLNDTASQILRCGRVRTIEGFDGLGYPRRSRGKELFRSEA